MTSLLVESSQKKINNLNICKIRLLLNKINVSLLKLLVTICTLHLFNKISSDGYAKI